MAKAKKNELIDVEIAQPKEVKIEKPKKVKKVISEKEQIKIELKKIQDLLNGGYDNKNRSSLLKSQMDLQIKLKSL